jgi:hypothetical protein
MFYLTLRKRKLSPSGRLLKIRVTFAQSLGTQGCALCAQTTSYKSMFRMVRYFNSLLGRDASANAAGKGNGARITIV